MPDSPAAMPSLVTALILLILNQALHAAPFADNRDDMVRALSGGAAPLTRSFIRPGAEERGLQPVQNQSMPATEEPSGRVNLRIEFDTNAATLRPGSIKLLDELAAALNHPKLRQSRIEIIGHTDSRGRESYNQQLSERRAASVERYLSEQRHIEATRLQSSGRGESQPLAPNTSPAGRQQNRRVEITRLQP
ncbi:OmpA family protein [Ectothiorhodospiraceae bacterium BW-2]|nr:OmpA family protein [Ectothiorhodospiraceae bacterium BW-2]